MEERILNLETQLKAALEELESIKKELAETRAENEKLVEENKNLKISVKEWQDKYENEHKLVIKLTEENEQLKAQIVELENLKKIEDEKLYDVADVRKYMEICNKIQELETKLETLDERERKADQKLLEMVQETKTDVVELKDTEKTVITEVADLMEAVDDLVREKHSSEKAYEREHCYDELLKEFEKQ